MPAEKPKSEAHLAPNSPKVSSVDFNNASSKPGASMDVRSRKRAAGGATSQPKPSIKNHVAADGHRSGARYGIAVKFIKQVAPEAGAVQGNGRLVPPAKGRTRPTFSAGMAL